MSLQPQPRKKWLRLVALTLLATMAFVVVFVAWRQSYRAAYASAHLPNWTTLNMIRHLLESLTVEDYPAFCRLPTNTIIRTSPEFVAALPTTIKDIYFGPARLWTANNVEKEGIVDTWGNWFNLFITVSNDVRRPPTTFWVLSWSNGPNGKNDFSRGYGKSDDVAMAPFTFTIDWTPTK